MNTEPLQLQETSERYRISVYLCEDDREQLTVIRKLIDNLILMCGYDMRICGTFLTPEETLDAVKEKDPAAALYFLDVDLKSHMDGIELAGKIRDYDPRAFIVFLTTHEEMAYRTLEEKVEPLAFLIKGRPDFAMQIESCLANAVRKYRVPNNPITDVLAIPAADGQIFLRKREIYYIKTLQDPHRIMICGESENICLRSSLKEIGSQLDERFFKCHGSFIINLTQVARTDKKTLTVMFTNGETCPCSIRKYVELSKRLKQRVSSTIDYSD